MEHIKDVINKYMESKGFKFDKNEKKYVPQKDMNGRLLCDDTGSTKYKIKADMRLFTKVTHFCLNHTNREAYNRITHARDELEKQYLMGKKDAYKEVVNFLMADLVSVDNFDIPDNSIDESKLTQEYTGTEETKIVNEILSTEGEEVTDEDE